MVTLTYVPVAEAAYIAELSCRDMNRVFDEHLVPDQLVLSGPGRRFVRLASAFALFYFRTDDIFAATLRRSVLAQLTERVCVQEDRDQILNLNVELARSAWVVQVSHGQMVDVSSFVDSAIRRARTVDEANTVIQRSEDIMDGHPVFKGTRVPLDVVTASLDNGISFERVKESYAFLTPTLVAAARVYQQVHPSRGRRRGIAEVHPDWESKEKRVVRPPRASAAT